MLYPRAHHPHAHRPISARRASASALAVGALALLTLVGCGATASASAGPSNASVRLPSVTITAHNFSFDMPASIPAGLVRLTFVNAGADVHQVQFFRLLPGVTSAQFIAALDANGPAATRTLGVPTGGADETAPGVTTQVINNFPAGSYVATCLVFDPEMHMFHYQMGMTGSLTAATTSASVTSPLADDGGIALTGMSVLLPANISNPGLRTFKVINDGPGVHALDILQLAPGKTATDVESYLKAPSGPPPFKLLGGLGGIAPATQGWIVVNLHPGNYVAACLVVDPVSHLPHAANGMLAGFTVPA